MTVKEDGDCRLAMEKAPKFRVKMENIKLAMKDMKERMRRPMYPAQAEQRP